MRFLAIALLCLVAGCTTPINSLEGRMSPKYTGEHLETITTARQHYFTMEALPYIEKIPCVEGTTFGGSYVIGANFWGTFVAVLSGNGYSPKCVMSEESLRAFGPEAFVHEYIHHLDASGRDGNKLFVDVEEFRAAYTRMSKDRRWAGLFYYAERRADRFITNWFGIGDLSEQMAYVGGRMAAQGSGPDYMWRVFRRVLRKP